MSEDIFNLKRFLEAQDEDDTYKQALKEIKRGRKTSHWIWFIFPQVKGLGSSYNTTFYGITCLDEAKAYLQDPVLRERLLEISEALYQVEGRSMLEIVGSIDTLKVHSCMTLFHLADDTKEVFRKVLDKFYDGILDRDTLRQLEKIDKFRNSV